MPIIRPVSLIIGVDWAMLVRWHSDLKECLGLSEITDGYRAIEPKHGLVMSVFRAYRQENGAM